MLQNKIVDLFVKNFSDTYKVYPASIKEKNDNVFFLVKDNQKKYLVIAAPPSKQRQLGFNPEKEKEIEDSSQDGLLFKICPLTHDNLKQLKVIFNYLRPSIAGNMASFGTGDRLGIATPAHIAAFQGKNIFPVLAQLSTREITRTESSLQKVMDNAIWGCFEGGYEGPFGADADHIKDFDNLQEAINCGFTLYTIDPSDHINKDIFYNSPGEIKNLYQSHQKRRFFEKVYLDKKYKIGNKDFYFDENSLAEIFLTYGKAVDFVEKCYKYLTEHNKDDFELEFSIDETDNSTSPLAHLWIVLELQRRGVSLNNLAPHFIGDWEKGVEYIGDVNKFKVEFKLHCLIAANMGGYKLSLHSGSDKFSVYPTFARETGNFFHIKTAGTSWLEAVKVVALCHPDLYREIHEFALTCFDKDRFSYHLSTDINNIPDIDKLSDMELGSLFANNNARQLIHITYGSILKEKDEKGQYKFRERIFKTLFDNEKTHYEKVSQHIKHHLDLLII
ncbi:MAG: tagaturonate epimerase family protein [Verrucomicrobia bacterium]|nr:tagaturonate epimerase family protein [Verrucomicrobiota bacterium]